MSQHVFRKLLWSGVAAACGAALCGAPAWAQSAGAYPAKPVRIIVPWPPGGGTDVASRLLGQKLNERLGQQFVVDNRAGAAGNLGAELAAKAAPDGYTMMISITSLAINPNLFAKLPFDINKDFLPVTMIARAPMVLIVHPSLPVDSAKGFIALARKRPGELNFAYTGAGTVMQMSGEMLNLATGAKAVAVSYKGGAPAAADVAAGQVHFAFPPMPTANPFLGSGRVRALAVTTAQRTPLAPELPTMAESGIKDYDFAEWYGAFFPAGTSEEIVRKIQAEIVYALKQPEIREKFTIQRFEVVGDSPEQFAASIRKDHARYGDIIRKAGIKIE
jgi:tripartite-type tricarboxylate transporter receptor subunit TctC